MKKPVGRKAKKARKPRRGQLGGLKAQVGSKLEALPKNEINKMMRDALRRVEYLRGRLVGFALKSEFEELKKRVSKLEQKQTQLEGITNELRAIRQEFAQKEEFQSLAERIRALELKMDQVSQTVKRQETIPKTASQPSQNEKKQILFY